MKAKDPKIRIVAVGAPGPWNDVIVRGCARDMDLLSGHHYTERKLRLPFSPDDARVYEQRFLAYSGDVAAGIRRLVEDFRKRLASGDPEVARIRLAIDEWGIVRDWNAAPDGPGVGAYEHYYCFGDAIAVARGLHEILRSADVVAMANWAQAVNVIGAIKTGKEGAVLDPAGIVLAEYRRFFSEGVLVPVSAPGGLALDAIAAWKPGALRVALVNYSPEEIRVSLRLTPRFEAKKGPARMTRIEGESLGSILVPRPPGEPGTHESKAPVRAIEVPVSVEGPMVLPARSIQILELEGERS